eukprot:gene16696-34736_t
MQLSNLVSVSSSVWIVAIGLLSSALCFLPLIFGESFKIDPSERTSSPLMFTISSVNFKYALVAGIGAATPLLMDFIRTSLIFVFSKSVQFGSQDWSFRLLLLALVIPNFVTFFVLCPSGYIEMIPQIYNMMNVLLYTALACALQKYGSPVWQPSSIILLQVLILFSNILDCQTAFMNPSNRYLGDITRMLLQLLSAVLFITLSIKWFINIFRRKSFNLSHDEYCCSSYTLIGYGMFARIALKLIFPANTWYEMGPNQFVATSLYMTGLLSMAMVMSGDVMRKENDMKQ